MNKYVVELNNITKRFPGVVALRNMSLQVLPGEVHGLVGENGAGKSTLIKTLTGVYSIDEGTILVDGKPMLFKTPNDAKSVGISCVYQELNIVKELSITDNIFMGDTTHSQFGFLDYSTMNKKAEEVLLSLGQEISPTTKCDALGMGLQQMVEIAKSVIFDAKIIIMDEPTSSLGEKEIEQLMETIRKLKDRGVAIIFVSHKLEELFEICDRVTVIRDGEHIITEDINHLDNDKLIHAMVGRSVENQYPKVIQPRGIELLRVEGLTTPGILNDISFSAYRGEILGFSGLIGAGRTETFRAIFGADPFASGKIFINDKLANNRTPIKAIKNKLAFLTEDRKGQGLVLSQSISTNLILANMKKYSRGLLLNKSQIEAQSRDNISALQIKTPSASQPVGQLSGGNQQKVVIGKWINTDAEIYIFDEPTRGIDVGAKVEVYNVMNKLVENGKCVIMISSELTEILGMSDRVIVMRTGTIMATIKRDSRHFNQEDIMKAAWGGNLSED